MEMSYLYLVLPYQIVYMFFYQNSFNRNLLVKDGTNCFEQSRIVSAIVALIVKRYLGGIVTTKRGIYYTLRH